MMKMVSKIGVSLVAATTLVTAVGCADEPEVTSETESGSTTNRYIVVFRDVARGKAAVANAGGQIVRELGPQKAVAAMLPSQAVNGLANNPHIDYLEEDVRRDPMALWNDTTSNGETVPFGVQMVQGDRVVSPNAANRKICIIDSGYSQQHDDLRDEATGAVTGSNNAGTGNWDMDSCGHGTHVAGTIAAINGNGTGVTSVNPSVKLHIVKVFGNDDLEGAACGWSYSSDLVAAVNECRAAGANVISMSLGGGSRSRTEDNAFKSAEAAGVLSIASAGNGGNKRTSYPAGYSSVVSVAAIDANETVAGFSQKNQDVEIAAPGVAVLSSVPWRETNALSAGSSTWNGGHVEGAARGSATGAIVDGGQCTAVGSWAGKTVLCQRGTISFAEKVANVASGGGAAAVIYNNVASDATCAVFAGTLGDGVTSAIPAITLSCADGAAAVAAAGSTGTVTSNVEIPSSGYAAWDGTSMAAPHVSAVAALVWSCDPSKTAAQIRDAIVKTAKDLGAAGRDTSYGHGLVQARAALEYLGLGSCSVR